MRVVPFYDNLEATPLEDDPSLVEVERIYCLDVDEFEDAHWSALAALSTSMLSPST